MSPVSRGRRGKRKNKSTRRSASSFVLGAADVCDCPSCSGVDFDLDRVIEVMMASAAELTDSEDPLDAELVGAAVMSIGADATDSYEEALIGLFIPEFQARANSEALALLLAIGSIAEGPVGKEASAAAGRLVEAGVPLPGWAAELAEPVTVADFVRLSDAQNTASMLACSFHRAGRSRAVLITVDHQDCGEARAIVLLDVDELPAVLEMMRASGRDDGLEITTEALDAAEFRWQVENALDARAVHDSAGSVQDTDAAAVDEEGALYPALAVLMRARMDTLPMPTKPPAPHGDEDTDRLRLAAMQLTQLGAGSPFVGTGPPARGRTRAPALR